MTYPLTVGEGVAPLTVGVDNRSQAGAEVMLPQINFGGWTCPNCGQWIYQGTFHFCHSWPVAYPHPYQDIQELKEEVKKLREAIERLERK